MSITENRITFLLTLNCTILLFFLGLISLCFADFKLGFILFLIGIYGVFSCRIIKILDQIHQDLINKKFN